MIPTSMKASLWQITGDTCLESQMRLECDVIKKRGITCNWWWKREDAKDERINIGESSEKEINWFYLLPGNW